MTASVVAVAIAAVLLVSVVAAQRAVCPRNDQPIERGDACEGASFVDVRLNGATLRDTRLDGSTFEDFNLNDSNGRNLSASGSTFKGSSTISGNSDFAEARFDGVMIESGAELVFRGANIKRASFSGARGEGTLELNRVQADGLKFTGATIGSAVISESVLVDSTWEGTTFGSLQVVDSNLARTMLSGVQTVGAQFSGVNLEGAKWKGANFTDATWSNVTADGGEFDGTVFDGAVFGDGVSFKDSTFQGTTFVGASFRGDLAGAIFSGANLMDIDFSGADLGGVDFRGASLEGAKFDGADLAGSDLRGATIDDKTSFVMTRGTDMIEGIEAGSIDTSVPTPTPIRTPSAVPTPTSSTMLPSTSIAPNTPIAEESTAVSSSESLVSSSPSPNPSNDVPNPLVGDVGVPESTDESTTNEDDEGNDDGSVCFPATATVELEDGSHVTMEDLAIGDRVRVSTGFSDVYFFSHKDSVQSHDFVSLVTRDHTVRLSPEHLINVVGAGLKAAKTIRIGDSLIFDGHDSVVLSVDTSVARGLYNPHTLSGDIVVDGFTASTYTSILPPKWAHLLLLPERLAYFAGTTLLGAHFHIGRPAFVTATMRLLK